LGELPKVSDFKKLKNINKPCVIGQSKYLIATTQQQPKNKLNFFCGRHPNLVNKKLKIGAINITNNRSTL
jgi:hypothetical protein